MTGWLLYAIEIGICVAVAGWSADALARIAGYPVRFVWLSAAFLSFALPIGVPLLAPVWAEHRSAAALSSFSFVQTTVLSVQQRVPTLSSTSIATLWGLGTILVALCFAFAFIRLHRMSRRWPATDFHGKRVRVAPSTGPMLLGVIRPDARFIVSSPTRLVTADRLDRRGGLFYIFSRENLNHRLDACTARFPGAPAVEPRASACARPS